MLPLWLQGLAACGDWPDVAAARASSPLLVQYCRDDQLFPLDGMRAADERMAQRYQQAGSPHAFVGEFFDGGHRFDVMMQGRRVRLPGGVAAAVSVAAVPAGR
ncbi:hypothetical protein ACQEVF_21300 [Nonomuraea polychroma]|uniref:hypothetical protein n=1 Tax=Nonomuraea polychroma TaxID=46176 RepID=UPI003D8A192C